MFSYDLLIFRQRRTFCGTTYTVNDNAGDQPVLSNRAAPESRYRRVHAEEIKSEYGRFFAAHSTPSY